MNQDKIWEYFQNDSVGLASFRVALPRYRFVASRITRIGRVLNIGVGSGGLETLLAAAGHELSCLDPSENSIAALRQRLGLDATHAQVGYSQAIPFPAASFDHVIMSEVLEHLSDDVLAGTLPEVRRVLRPGGVFLGTVPADEDLAAETTVCPDCGKVFHRWGHVQSFPQTRLAAILSAHFEQVSVARVLFGMGDQLNWKGQVGWLLKRAALALGVHGRGESLFFQARRP